MAPSMGTFHLMFLRIPYGNKTAGSFIGKNVTSFQEIRSQLMIWRPCAQIPLIRNDAQQMFSASPEVHQPTIVRKYLRSIVIHGNGEERRQIAEQHKLPQSYALELPAIFHLNTFNLPFYSLIFLFVWIDTVLDCLRHFVIHTPKMN